MDRLGADGEARHLLEEALDDVEVALAAAMEDPEHYDLGPHDEVRVREWREAMPEWCLADGRGLPAVWTCPDHVYDVSSYTWSGPPARSPALSSGRRG